MVKYESMFNANFSKHTTGQVSILCDLFVKLIGLCMEFTRVLILAMGMIVYGVICSFASFKVRLRNRVSVINRS